MKNGRPSLTARGVSFIRAAHQSLPASERISRDPFANQMLQYPLMRWLTRRNFLPRLVEKFRPGLIDLIAIRDRFADESARQVLMQGGQLVMLGAGLDTMPWRIDDLPESFRVIEVDFPATQDYRQKILEQRRMQLPGREIIRVAIDFESESLETRLREAGLRQDLPTLVNWMGVSYYLEEDVVRNVLQEIRALINPQSLLVFDFFLPTEDSANASSTLRKMGEPLKFFINPEEFPDFAGSCGYEIAELISMNELAMRYGNRNCHTKQPVMAVALRPKS